MIPILYLHERAEISGGETSLLLLWEHLDRRRFQPMLLGPAAGPLVERASCLGVSTCPAAFPRFRELLMPAGWSRVVAVAQRVRSVGPCILHGNTPHTNLAATLIGRRLQCPVVWHERTLPWGGEWDVDRWFRRWPDRIICNSVAVARRFGDGDGKVVVLSLIHI